MGLYHYMFHVLQHYILTSVYTIEITTKNIAFIHHHTVDSIYPFYPLCLVITTLFSRYTCLFLSDLIFFFLSLFNNLHISKIIQFLALSDIIHL